MLTRDLLRTKTAGQYIKPLFIRTDDPALLMLADSVLKICREGVGCTREYIENTVNSYVALYKDTKLARGIIKIIFDRLEYQVPEIADYRTMRYRAFRESAAAIREGNLPEKPQDFRNSLPSAAQFPEKLYDDLPENDKLCSIKDMFPREVLERYNMSLVQTLLIYTEKLELDLPADEDPQLFRAICRWLRFYRLLVTAVLEKKRIRMTIDGPVSIFENSMKYGLQTASFFPAVCRFAHWKAACTVKLKNTRRLLLDDTSGLVCHYTNFSSYRPEEIRMFAEVFQKDATDWTLDDAPGFLQLDDGRLIFPDFSFHSEKQKRTVYLELFHRWHASQLENRLAACRSGKIKDLLIGIDRSLLKKDGILAEELSSDDFFRRHGFFFRDYPGVKNVLTLLSKEQELF